MISSKTHFVSLGAIAVALAGVACGPVDTICESGDQRPECNASPENPIVKITVTPDGEVRDVDLGAQVAHTVCYRARVQFKNGNGAEITNTAIWSTDRPAMGNFPIGGGSCFETATNLISGGIIKIQASHGGVMGAASLIIKLIGAKENDGVGPGSFSGGASTDPAAKPALVYPLDESMHARNIQKMNIQFFSGNGNQVFKARFTSSQLDYTLYFRPTTCAADRCQWHVPPDQWKLIALTNGGTTATLTISGSDGGSGKVAQSDPIKIAFSPDDVIGGLYYFSTSLPGILRLAFQKVVADRATPFIVPNTLSNSRQCAGCHAITQDGGKITATYGSGDDFLGIAQGADAEMFISAMPPTNMAQKACGTVATDVCSNFQWFNQDGSKIISNFNGELILRDGNTGAEVARVAKTDIHPTEAPRQRAIMPEWSHAGDNIVFVRLLPESGTFYDVARGYTKRPGGDWLATDAGEIAIIPVSGNQFGPAKVLVTIPEGRNEYHYYPSFSPDDDWVVFNTGTRPGYSPVAQDTSSGYSYGVDPNKLVSYDQKTSRLRLVRAIGGGAIDLVKATYETGKTTSWPKFTPFSQRGGNLLFFTYSSKMDYGFVVTGGKLPQVWMAGLDLSRLGENSSDPSFRPFWLPFQDETQANHLTIWTTKIACEKDTKCGAGEFCQMGQCLPRID